MTRTVGWLADCQNGRTKMAAPSKVPTARFCLLSNGPGRHNLGIAFCDRWPASRRTSTIRLAAANRIHMEPRWPIMAEDVVVETRNLTKDYRDFWGRRKKRALNALNLQIHPGEIFGLLG